MLSAHRRDTYFGNLDLPADPVAAIGQLKGKSNFQTWYSTIQPILLHNSYSSELILRSWSEPPTSISSHTDEQASLDQKRRAWHAANTGTCRFIRETLAVNVIPFVRQYNSAKTLFFNLVWLYGEDAGIDTQGGPPVPLNNHTMSARKGRESLLAVLEAKGTLDYLPPASVTFRLPASPTTPNSVSTVASTSTSSSNAGGVIESGSGLAAALSNQAAASTTNLCPDVTPAFERIRLSPDPNLATIHEHDDPHPGRRIRISSGQPIGVEHIVLTDRSERSISPVTISDSESDSEDDEHSFPNSDNDNRNAIEMQSRRQNHTHTHTHPSSTKKRPASTEPESRPAKASILPMSILDAGKSGKKLKKHERFDFSFALKRLRVSSREGEWNGKGKGKDVTS